MPNLKSAPAAVATRAKQRSPRRSRGRHPGYAWWEAVKVAFLLERLRRRPRRQSSSPSLRQIALVVVSAGIALVIVRVATQRGKSHAGEAEAASPPPQSERESEVPGNESPLTDTVQQEMFHRSDAVHPDA